METNVNQNRLRLRLADGSNELPWLNGQIRRFRIDPIKMAEINAHIFGEIIEIVVEPEQPVKNLPI